MPIVNAAKRTVTPTNGRPRAEFGAQWLWPATSVISVHGDLDASNSAELTEYGIRNSRASGQLVLDLSEVRFFGASCVACLHAVNVRCAGEGIDWVLVPSAAVARVLRICDPARTVPTCAGLSEALSMLREQPRQLRLAGATH